MKFRSLVPLAAFALIPTTMVSIAFATASSGITPAVHVAGAQLPAGVKTNADGVKFQTKGPTEVSVLTLTVDPGGSTGWHSHPGLAVISVAEGTGKLYTADCTAQEFGAKEAFVEAGNDAPTLFRNESDAPVVLTVTFFAPRGAAIIRDEPMPGTCGLG
jgi:quercetin dioxygenase-like cupin family protein